MLIVKEAWILKSLSFYTRCAKHSKAEATDDRLDNDAFTVSALKGCDNIISLEITGTLVHSTGVDTSCKLTYTLRLLVHLVGEW